MYLSRSPKQKCLPALLLSVQIIQGQDALQTTDGTASHFMYTHCDELKPAVNEKWLLRDLYWIHHKASQQDSVFT